MALGGLEIPSSQPISVSLTIQPAGVNNIIHEHEIEKGIYNKLYYIPYIYKKCRVCYVLSIQIILLLKVLMKMNSTTL